MGPVKGKPLSTSIKPLASAPAALGCQATRGRPNKGHPTSQPPATPPAISPATSPATPQPATSPAPAALGCQELAHGVLDVAGDGALRPLCTGWRGHRQPPAAAARRQGSGGGQQPELDGLLLQFDPQGGLAAEAFDLQHPAAAYVRGTPSEDACAERTVPRGAVAASAAETAAETAAAQ